MATEFNASFLRKQNAFSIKSNLLQHQIFEKKTSRSYSKIGVDKILKMIKFLSVKMPLPSMGDRSYGFDFGHKNSLRPLFY